MALIGTGLGVSEDREKSERENKSKEREETQVTGCKEHIPSVGTVKCLRSSP